MSLAANALSELSEPIYKRDSAGKIRVWQVEVNGAMYRTHAGIDGGSLVTSGWTVCEPKNVGRANETTAEQQAQFEGNAEMQKKLRREYRRTLAELDSVPAGPMLAQDYKKQKGLKFPLFSQPKLDGIRATADRRGAFTRELQPHYNIDHIVEALAPFTSKYDIIFDGELYNHELKDDFNKIGSVVRKQKATAEQRAESARLIQFHIYDMIVPRKPELVFQDRIATLRTLLQNASPVLRVVPTVHVGNQDLLDELYAEYIADGFEGQMVRLNEPYEVDLRSKHLLKRKEFITEEFPIKRIEEGKGNWAGYAKRIVLDVPDAPDGEVGSNMRGSQAFAKELLEKARAGVIPKQATVRHFGRTPDRSLRFPVAIDFHVEGRAD